MTDDIRLEMTCASCPEQYDAFIGDEQVGYLRMRHGRFTVECPDCGGRLVLIENPEGYGSFIDDEEREFYLRRAKRAITKWREERAYAERLKARAG